LKFWENKENFPQKKEKKKTLEKKKSLCFFVRKKSLKWSQPLSNLMTSINASHGFFAISCTMMPIANSNLKSMKSMS
jgi:hypothetical protein